MSCTERVAPNFVAGLLEPVVGFFVDYFLAVHLLALNLQVFGTFLKLNQSVENTHGKAVGVQIRFCRFPEINFPQPVK
jgi:hypothetical protein